MSLCKLSLQIHHWSCSSCRPERANNTTDKKRPTSAPELLLHARKCLEKVRSTFVPVCVTHHVWWLNSAQMLRQGLQWHSVSYKSALLSHRSGRSREFTAFTPNGQWRWHWWWTAVQAQKHQHWPQVRAEKGSLGDQTKAGWVVCLCSPQTAA